MKKLLALFSLFAASAFGQSRITPDCVIPFNFTAVGSTSNLTCGAPNGQQNGPGIASWIIVYSNSGFSAVCLDVQSAPDSSGSPGSWVTFAGTILTSTQYPGSSGINPNTATTSAFTGFAGYYPWMRVTLETSGGCPTTGSGTVKGTLYGFLNSTLAKAGGGSGSCSGDINTACSQVVNLSHVTNSSLANSGLANPSMTVNGVTCTLGGSCSVGITGGTCSAGEFVDAISSAGVITCASPAGASGGSAIGYSAPAVTLPSAGTVYIPPVGGALPSSTETNVQWLAPVTSALSNLGVIMSTAIGSGNSITFTVDDNTTPQSVTCTISGASAKTCSDLTHTFNVTEGDLLDISMVTTGTVVVAPTITIAIEYGGGGSTPAGPSYHFQYYYSGVLATITGWSITGPASCSNTFTLPSGATPSLVCFAEFQTGGNDAMIMVQLPSTWDGSNILMNVDAVFADNSAGTANFRAYSACSPAGTVFNAPTWTAASTTVGATGGTSLGIQRWALSIPVTSCTAGNFAYLDLNRPTGDSYGSTIFMLGANVGIKY